MGVLDEEDYRHVMKQLKVLVFGEEEIITPPITQEGSVANRQI